MMLCTVLIWFILTVLQESSNLVTIFILALSCSILSQTHQTPLLLLKQFDFFFFLSLSLSLSLCNQFVVQPCHYQTKSSAISEAIFKQLSSHVGNLIQLDKLDQLYLNQTNYSTPNIDSILKQYYNCHLSVMDYSLILLLAELYLLTHAGTSQLQ